MSKVLLENVGKTFDGKKMVLNDFSLQIDDGDFVVLIGPSGCGKTTILNIIAGLECPTTGNVYIDDALSNSVEPKDRDVAMVFQNHALYPHLSVYKNLAFPLKLRKYSKKDIEKEVFFIANLLNIAELLNRKPNQLSGGQQQRVAIGKALIRNPSLFLMDEPLSSLDAELKILLRTEIKELHSKLKSTFVYVTHDQSEAMSLSTKLVVIKDGIIQQTGTPYEVFIRPTNKFVASFIGQHKINFFDLDVVGSKIYFGKSIIEISKIFNVKTISIGIRPEDFVLDSNGSIALSITNIEILGNEMLVTGKFGERFAASVILPTDINIKNGDIVTLSISPV